MEFRRSLTHALSLLPDGGVALTFVLSAWRATATLDLHSFAVLCLFSVGDEEEKTTGKRILAA